MAEQPLTGPTFQEQSDLASSPAPPIEPSCNSVDQPGGTVGHEEKHMLASIRPVTQTLQS